MHTTTCPTCQTTYKRPTMQTASDALWACDSAHRAASAPPAVVTQLPTVGWHRQALDAILALAVSGKPFVISQVIEYGVPDAPRPRTDWPKVQREAEGLGWIKPDEPARAQRAPDDEGLAVHRVGWDGRCPAGRGAAARRMTVLQQRLCAPTGSEGRDR